MIEALWQVRELPALLEVDLRAPAKPPGARDFAPQLSYGRHAGPARGDVRHAAVAIVLCWDGGQWSLPLTVRNAQLTHHGGQVSLPGGLIDAGESPRDAAARELEEELGQRPPVQWLGELSPLFVFASNALVTPCVAAIGHWPDWTPQPAEVDRVLKLDLAALLDPPQAPPLSVQRGPFHFQAPQLIVEGQSAWGATAVMLGELRSRLLRISNEHN
jgi:8-oxo-dGTP pyrophosphatase MutT (NUDIX family)